MLPLSAAVESVFLERSRLEDGSAGRKTVVVHTSSQRARLISELVKQV